MIFFLHSNAGERSVRLEDWRGRQKDECLPSLFGKMRFLYATRRLEANGLSLSQKDTLVTDDESKMT